MAMAKLKGHGWLRVTTTTDKDSPVIFHEPMNPVEGGIDTAKLVRFLFLGELREMAEVNSFYS